MLLATVINHHQYIWCIISFLGTPQCQRRNFYWYLYFCTSWTHQFTLCPIHPKRLTLDMSLKAPAAAPEPLERPPTLAAPGPLAQTVPTGRYEAPTVLRLSAECSMLGLSNLDPPSTNRLYKLVQKYVSCVFLAQSQWVTYLKWNHDNASKSVKLLCDSLVFSSRIFLSKCSKFGKLNAGSWPLSPTSLPVLPRGWLVIYPQQTDGFSFDKH